MGGESGYKSSEFHCVSLAGVKIMARIGKNHKSRELNRISNSHHKTQGLNIGAHSQNYWKGFNLIYIFHIFFNHLTLRLA